MHAKFNILQEMHVKLNVGRIVGLEFYLFFAIFFILAVIFLGLKVYSKNNKTELYDDC